MGTGLGLENPDKIPEVHTDFIFSAIGQDWSWMGAVAVVLLYLCFIYRGFKIARRLSDPYDGLLAAGVATAFSLQVFIILAQ